MTKKKKPNIKIKANVGRPSDYTSELGQRICDEVSISVDGLEKICARNPEFPEPTTIYKWRIRHAEFSHRYEDAKRNQAELLAVEILKIADDSSCDSLIKQDRDGNDYEVMNTEFVARSRLRIDARKWIVAKLLPKVYGETKDKDEASDILKSAKDALDEVRSIAQKCMKPI